MKGKWQFFLLRLDQFLLWSASSVGISFFREAVAYEFPFRFMKDFLFLFPFLWSTIASFELYPKGETSCAISSLSWVHWIMTTPHRVKSTNRTGNIIPLDWTLGAYIVQTMVQPVYAEQDSFGQIVGNESVTYFSLFAVLLILALAITLILQLRKPQFKTIYDLEKGRYIVTRIPRWWFHLLIFFYLFWVEYIYIDPPKESSFLAHAHLRC